MIITTNYDTLVATMATVSTIVSDKLLKDDFKNVIFWVKDGKVSFGAYGGIVTSATETNAEVDVTEGEHFIQLKAKDINDALATFSGLKRTRVSKVEFHIGDNDALMHVFEEPADEEMEHADKYRQTARFRITKPKMKDIVQDEIQKVGANTDGTLVNTGDLLVFVNALYPTVAKETRESTYNIMFSDEHIYTVPAQYAAVMPNRLPEVFRGFRLSNSMVNFLKNFIGSSETFTFAKDVHGNGMVVLTVGVAESMATIKCPDMSRAYDVTAFMEIPSTGVVVDKEYLKDVLKRISLGNEPASITITLENGFGRFQASTKTMTQEVPVAMAKGEGVFAFEVRADLLSNLIFSHADYLKDHVFLYLASNDRGQITLAVKDETELWHTKIGGLAQSKGDFDWSRQTNK